MEERTDKYQGLLPAADTVLALTLSDALAQRAERFPAHLSGVRLRTESPPPGTPVPSSRHVSSGSPSPFPALLALPAVAEPEPREDRAQSIMGNEAPRASSFQMLLLLLLLLLRAEPLQSAELTFELPDNAKQCFHEEVEQGVKFSLDYQVRP